MRIALCDDQKTLLEELSGMINRFNEDNHLSGVLLYFSRPESLYSYMITSSIDVIIMDLVFKNTGDDGIDWSKKILRKFPNTIIIILTAYESRYKEGYEARAFRFMTKPVQEKELYNYLSACRKELQLNETISLIRRGIPQQIPLQDIFYLSAQSGGSELWTRSDMYAREESLLQWEQQLPSLIFFRCHKKYLVNLNHVTGFDNHMLTLTNGEKIPVSRRKWKAFLTAFMKYDIQRGRS